MPAIDFNDIAQLLNFSRTTRIDLTPVKSGRDGKWSLFKGSHKVHTSEYPFQVLYLKAAAATDDIRVALRESRTAETHLVYPQSLSRLIQRSTELSSLVATVKGRWTAREYLVSFIKDEIQVYLQRLAAQAPRDYIDPRIETPAGFVKKIPNPVLSFLRDPASDESKGQLGIVLAEPGQGKTYMSRYLVSHVSESDKDLVPLMVDSSQWHTMSVDDQRLLSKTIAHSFRHFGAAIGWLDGHEDQFLRATLKADLFRIVFDGFDEYILRNRGAIQPIDALNAIGDLASATGTRIVITSRTSFWNTNLAEQDTNDFVARTGAVIFKILPFDTEHAKNYFRRRLGDETRVARASKMFMTLRTQANEAFVGRGFVLSLIADLSNSDPKVTGSENPKRPMHWLCNALCQREMLRQQLPFTAEEQITTFRTFAVEVAEGARGSSETLELSLSFAKPTIDAPSTRAVLEKLKSHPLIEWNSDTDEWSFKQDQIRILLLAEHLVFGTPQGINRFAKKGRLDPGAWQDLGTMLVDIVRAEYKESEAIEQLKNFIALVSDGSPGELPFSADEGTRLGSIVALTAVEQFLPRGSTHSDRTILLLRLTGGDAIKNKDFTGTVARFDLRGVSFEHCRFERLAWANCKFDESSIFKNCQFTGDVPPMHCEGLGLAQFIDCRFDPEAEAILNSLRVQDGKRRYSVEDLRADIDSLLRRFVISGGVGLKTIEKSTLLKGPIGASRYREEIIDSFRSMIIEEHHVSPSGTGLNIRESAAEAVKFYATNNVYTGPLREMFDRIRRKLELE